MNSITKPHIKLRHKNIKSVYFVGRHQGSIDWVAEHSPIPIDHYLTHLDDFQQFERGDLVIGNLPVHIVHSLNERGTRFWHLAFDVPESKRGQELTCQELEQYSPRLHEYWIYRSNESENYHS